MRARTVLAALLSLSVTTCVPLDALMSSGTSADDCSIQFVQPPAGTWLLTEPEIHLVFWGDYWSDTSSDGPVVAGLFQAVWAQLLNDDEVLQRLSQYGIREGTLDANYYSLNGLVPSGSGEDDAGLVTLNDGQIPTTLSYEIQRGFIPYPNDNTVYVVMLPRSVTTQVMVSNSYLGYHDSSSYSDQRYAYAVLVWNDDPNVTDTYISHEVYEAATDPQVGTGYVDQDGDELADVCQGSTETIGGRIVQEVWSQATCECQ